MYGKIQNVFFRKRSDSISKPIFPSLDTASCVDLNITEKLWNVGKSQMWIDFASPPSISGNEIAIQCAIHQRTLSPARQEEAEEKVDLVTYLFDAQSNCCCCQASCTDFSFAKAAGHILHIGFLILRFCYIAYCFKLPESTHWSQADEADCSVQGCISGSIQHLIPGEMLNPDAFWTTFSLEILNAVFQSNFHCGQCGAYHCLLLVALCHLCRERWRISQLLNL